jgi:flagellar biosynthesis/type III secretory pathway chaperone
LNVETVQLRSLSEQLHQVSQHMEQPNALDESAKRIREICSILQKTNSSL